MLSTGIPELQSEEDISYLREAFSLDMNDAQARDKFKNLIYESLTTKTTQFNNGSLLFGFLIYSHSHLGSLVQTLCTSVSEMKTLKVLPFLCSWYWNSFENFLF